MRWLNDHLVMLTATMFLALTVSTSEPSTLLVASIAVVGISVVLTASCAVRLSGARELTVGQRAHEHRESLSDMPAPQHPDTAGRPRPRAPSQSPRVA